MIDRITIYQSQVDIWVYQSELSPREGRCPSLGSTTSATPLLVGRLRTKGADTGRDRSRSRSPSGPRPRPRPRARIARGRGRPGTSAPDLSGARGRGHSPAPARPQFVRRNRGRRWSPRPRPRFAEIGDQAVLRGPSPRPRLLWVLESTEVPRTTDTTQTISGFG